MEKVFEFVCSEFVEKKISNRTKEDVLKQSVFATSVYLGKEFPLYRAKEYWPQIEEESNNVTFRFEEGLRGEVYFGEDYLLRINEEIRQDELISLTHLFEEVLLSYLYFSRVIDKVQISAKFSFWCTLKNFNNIWIDLQDLKEDKNLSPLKNLKFLNNNSIQNQIGVLLLPTNTTTNKGKENTKQIIGLLQDIAFNIEGTRFDVRRGKIIDRLRLTSESVKQVISNFYKKHSKYFNFDNEVKYK
jgi:hypothetical protein